jgi:hypothetical protein
MKKIIKFSFICLTAMFFLVPTSCKEDSDTTKPVIELIEPEDDDILQIGDVNGVHLEMKLSDNEALASYKIEIHPNFDGHSHAQAREVSETVDFTFDVSWNDIRGKKNADIHHHEIKIPENATPGHYHLMVYCTDVAGNESHVAIDVELSHEAGEHHHDD